MNEFLITIRGISIKDFAQKFDGIRTDEVKGIAPLGWVVSKDVPPEIWKHIKTSAIPLRPGGSNLFARMKAEIQLAKVRKKYGSDVFVLMVPDEESLEGWSARPVLPSDFDRDPHQVLREGSQASTKGDFHLEEMKRCAFMAMTGQRDTK